LAWFFGNRFLHKTDKAENRGWARTASTQDRVWNLCIGPAPYIAERWGTGSPVSLLEGNVRGMLREQISGG